MSSGKTIQSFANNKKSFFASESVLCPWNHEKHLVCVYMNAAGEQKCEKKIKNKQMHFKINLQVNGN